MEFKLLHPIDLSSETQITKLKMRDYAVAGDYLAFDKQGGVAQRIALIASMAGTDEELIKKLHGADYVRAEAYVSKLLDSADAQASPAHLSAVEPTESASDQAVKK
jgi:hypothetical protein